MTFGDRQQTRIRQKLLTRVRQEVQAHLSQSLHHRVLQSLSDDPNPLQTRRPGDIQVKISGSATTELEPTTSPFNLFDQVGGVWVVLGNLGSGKTTTLLELAYEAIARAQTYGHQPVPLLFDLAQWDKKPFFEWLVDQSYLNSPLKRAEAKQWLKGGKILLIFDNFDALSFDRQNQTLQAIKELQTNVIPSLNLILSARIDSYKRCPTRLKLQGAIWLKPLNSQQIQDYLMQARSRELWQNIREDKELITLAKTPLFLNLMTLADEEILIHAWQRITDPEQRYRYLLNAYLRRMLTQDPPKDQRRWYAQHQEPRPEQTKHWLIALAKWMQRQNARIFVLNHLNVSYLQTPEQKRAYQLGVGVLTGLLLGVLCGAIAALMEGLGLGLMMGLILGIIFGVAGTLNFSLGFLQKFMLRYVLYRHDVIPWNYRQFLNYAASKGFLQRVSDRYQFPHELLQEHFAQIEELKL